MSTKAKMTPEIDAEGRYKLRAPWTTDMSDTYRCIAIRSFEDIYKLGEDVYSLYYLPMGLVDGQDNFYFKQEVAASPNIITLMSNGGKIVYVPDTYIEAYPTLGEIKYNHVVLAVSLGPLPENINLTDLLEDVGDLITARIGKEVMPKLAVAPSNNQPTAEQHEILEAARQGSITTVENNYTKLRKAEQNANVLSLKVNNMVDVLRHNNLI